MKQEQIDALRHLRIPDQALLIDGQWAAAASGQTLPVVSPIDGQQLCTIAAAGQADVDHAVQAARRSFESGVWSRMAPAERKKILHRIADRIEAHHAELAELTPRHGAFSTPPFDAAVALVARGIASFFVREQFEKRGLPMQAFQHIHRVTHRELQPAASVALFEPLDQANAVSRHGLHRQLSAHAQLQRALIRHDVEHSPFLEQRHKGTRQHGKADGDEGQAEQRKGPANPARPIIARNGDRAGGKHSPHH